ncbi:hypothetical protein C3F09_02310 [candidate division GN15 bacterium]|uniref:PorV/PorQ family protein n=1 Tax=candidate division GN15 bacterium TaxID=2072418 RepID=A0A855X6D0_9BACT|nr:MAG: hypothetical protein C3F09_02310 [candidate division GN15 bacterium]
MKARTNMKFLGLLLGTILCIAGSALSADGNGGYAGSFLQVPIGARPTGMGGAYLALSNDAAGVLFNPAGLNTLEKPLFGTSYRAMTLDRTLGYATLIFPVRGQSALGIHWLYAGSGSVRVRDASGIDLGRDFSQNTHVFGVVFAKRFSNIAAVGTKLSYMQASIPEVKAYSIAFDFGATFYLSQLVSREKRDKQAVQDIQVAVVVKNLSAKFPWNSEKYTRKYTTDQYAYEQDDKVPIEAGLGASARFLKRKLILASDLRKADKQNVRFYGGAEYYITPEFALRSGYGDKRLAAGAGFMFKMGSRALAIDYAFSADKVDEGSEHIFSFDLLF